MDFPSPRYSLYVSNDLVVPSHASFCVLGTHICFMGDGHSSAVNFGTQSIQQSVPPLGTSDFLMHPTDSGTYEYIHIISMILLSPIVSINRYRSTTIQCIRV